jgi:hypothetical protein
LKRPARSEPKDKSQTVSTVGAYQKGMTTAACYRAQRRGFSPGGGFVDWLEAEWQINAAVKYVTGGQNWPFPEACLHTNAQMVSLTDVVVYESTVKENAHVDTNDQKQTERKRRIAAD